MTWRLERPRSGRQALAQIEQVSRLRVWTGMSRWQSAGVAQDPASTLQLRHRPCCTPAPQREGRRRGPPKSASRAGPCTSSQSCLLIRKSGLCGFPGYPRKKTRGIQACAPYRVTTAVRHIGPTNAGLSDFSGPKGPSMQAFRAGRGGRPSLLPASVRRPSPSALRTCPRPRRPRRCPSPTGGPVRPTAAGSCP